MNTHAINLQTKSHPTSSPQIQPRDDTEYVAFKYGDPKYAALLRQFFRLRKEVFIDDLQWDLNEYDGMEIDQYDQETAEYILQLKDGKCIGGCRLLPTTTKIEKGGEEFTYMLRDAHLGRLASFPRSVTERVPVSDEVWELTRVVSAKNPIGFRDLMEQVRHRLKGYGVTDCLFITRTAISRICKFWGYDIEVVGPELSFGTMKAVTVNCKIEYFKDQLQ